MFALVNNLLRLPCRRHRSQLVYSKGILHGGSRIFGGLPVGCDPIRSAGQVGPGRIHRLSHWTTPP